MALLYDGNTNIRDLPAMVMREVRTALDMGPESSNWRAFCALMQGIYTFKQSDIEGFAVKFQAGRSPSDSILLQLGGKGMKCSELVDYLDQLRLERVLQLLRGYVPISIVEHPPAEIRVMEGESFKLQVEATGFPYPRYQWFKDRQELVGAIESTLTINNAKCQHSGSYCCRVVNHSEGSLAMFSSYCSVTVSPSVRQPPTPEADFRALSLSKAGAPVTTLPVIDVHPKDKTVNIGSTFHLECQARGHLPLHYYWYHNAEFHEENQGVLTMKDTGIEGAGNFYCVVKNDFGEATSRRACVVVNAVNIPEMTCIQVKDESTPIAPTVYKHPVTCTIERGGNAFFTCEAYGTPPLQYQWFHNGSLLQDATLPHLKLLNVTDVEKEGLYQCLVTNNTNSNGEFSEPAMLRISRTVTSTQQFTATDKVALLIGNYDYRNEKPLKAPKTDIHYLGLAFREVGFKVVSLLNLNRVEMISALYHFSELLGKGVYGVFYFCGHGFEENGKCYLIPWDAQSGCQTHDCLCADFVLKEMQRNSPKLCALILDICRRPNKVASPESLRPQSVLPDQSCWSAGNTIICYATSIGMSAYEDTNQRQGILVSHLAKYIIQPYSIESVFSCVKRDVAGDDRLKGRNAIQLPEVRSNLIDIDRSFADKVQYRGHTADYHRRQTVWECAHKRPSSQMLFLKPPELGIAVELDFQAEFSNVLNIFITVKNKGNTEECVSWVSKIPNNLTCSEPIIVSKGDDMCVTTKNELKDVQKLKCDLVVTIAARYRLPGMSTMMTEETTFNLHKPLVSILQLWKSRPDGQGSREPSENVDAATPLSPHKPAP